MPSRLAPACTTVAAFGPSHDPCYVMALAPSPDGAHLAASLSTNAVKIYARGDAPSGGDFGGGGGGGGHLGTLRAVTELSAHDGAVTDCAFPIPSEPWTVLTSSADATIRAWDLRQGGERPCASYVAPFATRATGGFATATAGGVGDHLVVAGWTNQIVFWDRRTREGLRAFEDAHSEDVTRVRFQPTRRNRLFTASVDGLACVFDVGGCPADVDDEDGLLCVMTTDCSIVELGFCGGREAAGSNDADSIAWVLTGNEDAWAFDAGADLETLGSTLAHVPNTRAAAFSAAAQGASSDATASSSFSRGVDYLLGCFRVRPGEGEGDGASSVVVAAGTQDGAVGLFPIVPPRDGSGDVARCELAAPTRVLDGGHADIVRACVLWDWDADAAAPATGGEDSRVVLWGAAGGAGGGDGSSGGGKAARSESAETEYHDRGRRRHSPY